MQQSLSGVGVGKRADGGQHQAASGGDCGRRKLACGGYPRALDDEVGAFYEVGPSARIVQFDAEAAALLVSRNVANHGLH